MAALNALEQFEKIPNCDLKEVVFTVANTADAADTLAITLADYGISATGLIRVLGWKHTTDGSVMVQEQPTTAVAAGVLTITIPAGTDNDYRVYEVLGRADAGDFA